MIRPYIKQMLGEFFSHPKTTLVNRNVIHDRVRSRQIHILKQTGCKFCICCANLPFDCAIGPYKHRLPGRYVSYALVSKDVERHGAALAVANLTLFPPLNVTADTFLQWPSRSASSPTQ